MDGPMDELFQMASDVEFYMLVDSTVAPMVTFLPKKIVFELYLAYFYSKVNLCVL